MKKKIKIPRIRISMRMNCKTNELHSISSSSESVNALRQLFDNQHLLLREQMVLLCLNRANKIIGYELLSEGGVSGTVCDPKMVFVTALNCNASCLILAHNHPSGNANPSQSDKEITNKIREGARLLDMTLLDHIIITDHNYFSFNDEGLI